MEYSIPRGAYVGMIIALLAGLAACGKAPSTRPPTATGGPAFVINSPADGSFTAGTFVFSVQPLDPGEISKVEFSAGGKKLDPSGDLRAFVTAAEHPEGPLELTATVTGTDGRSRSRSVTVQNVPVPESSATVSNRGAVLGTFEEDGSLSTLVVPPGGIMGGNVSFESRTQDEVRAETGVDYDSLGITFLGAQSIGTDTEIDRTLMVTSGGFGPAVQPGQVVVNYLIMPDGNGDGVGEIIVANTASVTPGGDVISDPVPAVQVGDTATATRLGSSSIRSLDGTLSGPPGTLLEIPVAGFNPAAAWNNVAIFDGAGGQLEQTGVIHTSASGAQTFVTVIPPLRPGTATVTLHNIGSGLSSDPFRLTVEAMPAVSGDPLTVINSAHADILAMLQDFDSAFPGTDSAELRTALSAVLEYWITSLQADGSAEAEAALAGMASMIEVSDLRGTVSDVRGQLAGRLSVSQAGCNDILQKADKAIEVVNWVGRVPYTQLSPTNAVDILGAELQGGMVGEGWKGMKKTALEIDRALGGNACDNGAPPLPGPTGPSRSNPNGTGAISGMGAAFTSGGPLVGSVNGEGFNAFSPSSSAQNRGRYSVQLSSSTTIPFSGSTDAGGYFMIPMTPAGETIEVHVIDTETGDVETVEVEAPPAGESTFLHIDFSEESVTETVTWTGRAGDDLWSTPANWSSNALPGPNDHVVISSAGSTVTLYDGFPQTTIRSLTLQSGTLFLDGSAKLTLMQESRIGVAGALYLVSGNAQLDIFVSLSNEGSVVWSGGTIGNVGVLTNRNRLEVFPGHGLRVLHGNVVNEELLIMHGSTRDGLRVGHGGTIRNAEGAVMDIQDDFGIAFGGKLRGVIYNAGTLHKSGGTGTAQIDATFNNEGGHLAVTSGTLLLRSGGSLNDGSTYNVGRDASIAIGAGTANFTITGQHNGTGAGTLALTGGFLEVAPAGATLTFPEGGVQLAGTTIRGEGELRNAGELEVVSDSTLYEIVLVNEGRITLHGPSTRSLGIGQGGSILNLAGSVIEVAGDADIYFDGVPYGTLINQGTVHKTSGTGGARLNVDFRNELGTVAVDSGALTLEYGSGTGGTFNVAGGATLNLGWSSTRELHLAGSYSGNGFGAIRLAGTLIADPAGVSLNFPNGVFQWQGTIEGPGATVTNNSLIEVDMGSANAYLYDVTLVNNERIVMLRSGTGNHTFRAGIGAIIDNVSGAEFDIEGDLDITFGGGYPASIRNAGTLNKSAGSGIARLAVCYSQLPGGVLLPNPASFEFRPNCN